MLPVVVGVDVLLDLNREHIRAGHGFDAVGPPGWGAERMALELRTPLAPAEPWAVAPHRPCASA